MIWFRRAGRDDIPAMFAIRTGVRENHMSRENLAAIGILPETVAELLETDGAGWMAGLGDEPAGFALAVDRDASLFALFVAPGAEGRGIGRALIGAAEAWLFARHPHIRLQTEAAPGNRAHGFYRRMGWSPAGPAPDGQIAYEKWRDPF